MIGMTLGIISAPDQLIYLQEEGGRLAVIPAPLLLRVTASSFLDGPVPTAATGQERVGRTSGTQLTGEGKTKWTGLCSVGDL